MMNNQPVIVCAQRTAIGSFNGAFAPVSAVELGSTVIQHILAKTGLDPASVDEVILGNVLQAGLGQNPARQTQLAAGIPDEVSSFTVNKVCGSGLKCVALAAQAIQAGNADIILAGGMENMSQAPYVLDSNARWGLRMGDATLRDEMLTDGLTCAMNHYHMGITAENIAEEYHISRGAQDEIAFLSQRKARIAQETGAFDKEIVPVTVKTRKSETIVKMDEFPRHDTTMDGLSRLRPAFKKDGTVTAGNASGVNDGAAVLLVMSERRAHELGLQPMARIRGYCSGGVSPAMMGLGPIPASRKAFARAGVQLSDIDLIEANEAFAAQFIVVGQTLGFDMEKVNVNGGAIALGHPIGASGARILVTLLHALQARDQTLGLATLCIGGGQGFAMVVERI